MDDRTAMQMAIDEATVARVRTSPNPWVGAVVVSRDGAVAGAGATEPPGGRHAEVVALDAAGARAAGATLVVTLEPCDHHGRTGPCTEAIVAAGIARVVVGVADPDPRVSGRGIDRLRTAGIDVDFVPEAAPAVTAQLEPYLHHRRTGRPFVVAKLASSLDGGTAAPDGTSQWITGHDARVDVHRLRAESDAILVGANTVRADDPSLTVRHVDGPDPLRVVLGTAPDDARVRPCIEWQGDLVELLDDLGRRGILQLLVEGGATVLRSFHDLDLVDRYVLYLAPALFGGAEMRPVLGPPTAPTLSELWRGRFDDVTRVGADLRVGLRPTRSTATLQET